MLPTPGFSRGKLCILGRRAQSGTLPTRAFPALESPSSAVVSGKNTTMSTTAGERARPAPLNEGLTALSVNVSPLVSSNTILLLI